MSSPADTHSIPPSDGRPRRAWWLLPALIAVVVLECAPLFARLDHYGRADWDQFTFRYETPRVALLRDHQLPLWNPYANGGTVLFAHPDCPAASPWYLIVLGLGSSLGLRVQVALFMLLGMVGMARLLSRWQVRPAGQFVGAVIFMMSGHFTLHIAEGHLEWCVLGLMPWLMLCLLKAQTDLRWIVVAGLLFASVLTFGAVYIPAVYVPFLTIWTMLECVRLRSYRPGLIWSGVLGLTVLLSAVKLLPQLEFVRQHPRFTPSEGISAAVLPFLFLDPQQAHVYKALRDSALPPRLARFQAVPLDDTRVIAQQYFQRGFIWNIHEYGCYITYPAAVLAVCGLLAAWRALWPLYSAGGTALVLALGNGSPIDFWNMLRHLPLYSSLHVPSRFMAAIVFVLAVVAGCGFGRLCDWLARSRFRRLFSTVAFVVPAVITAELLLFGWSLFGDIFVFPPLAPQEVDGFAMRYRNATCVYYPGMASCLYPRLLSNSGVLHSYENIAVKQGAVHLQGNVGYRGEAYLKSGRGSLDTERWTMGRVVLSMQVHAADRVILNQNYFTGWRATVLSKGRRHDVAAGPNAFGLVSVDVQPGDRQVEFYYSPKSFLWGAGISGGTLVGCIGFFAASRLQRRRRSRPRKLSRDKRLSEG